MTTTVSFTRCCAGSPASLPVALLLVLAVWLLGGGPVRAQAPASEVTEMRLERAADGLLLYATVRVDLPAAVEEALSKGVPMIFVAEAEVVRRRWYWSDKTVATAQRHIRLAYQPLTRRWRVNLSAGPSASGTQGIALNQNFDSLHEAMAAVQRISGWKLADVGAVEPDVTYKVDFRFALDLTQLPRPFQIGALGHSDWSISATASQQLAPVEARK